MREPIYRRNSIFTSWLLSYIFILFIPMIIGVFVYAESKRLIENETNRSHTALLKQFQQVMDGRLRDIEKLSLEISLNEKINELMYLRKPIEPFHRYTMVNIIKELKSYKIANGFINNLYIYFKNNNFVLSYQGRYDAEEFYTFNYKEQGLTYDEWMKVICDKHERDYIPLNIKLDNGILKNNIVFIRSLPVGVYSPLDANLVIQIDEGVIYEAIKGLEWTSQGILLVIDKNNNILASTKPISLPKTLSYDKLTKFQNIYYSKFSGEEVVISYITSGAADWKYISIVPTSIFHEKAKYINNIILVYTILCLLIGCLVAYLFAKRNYNPVSKMIYILTNKVGIPMNTENNEYGFIEESILQVIDEKEKIHKRLEQQKDVLRNSFLSRLIRGCISDNTFIQDACQSYDISFAGNYFAVILFYIGGFSNFFFEGYEKGRNSEEIFKKAHFIMRNIVEELAGQNNQGYIVEINDTIVCLMNFKGGDKKQAKDDMLRIAKQSKEIIKRDFGIYFSISISDMHTGIGGIQAAYQEAIETIEYKMLTGNEEVFCYDDIKFFSEKQCRQNYYLEQEQQFMNCIKIGDYKSAKKILKEIFKNNFSSAPASIQIAKCRMFGLVNTMLNVVGEIGTVCENEFLEELNPINQLLNCKTIIELQDKMVMILERFDRYFQEKKDKEDTKLISNIIHFIENHYTDTDLSVSMVADKFSISITYLSKFFKKHMGIGVLDYIHKVRIEKAKQLIKEENLSIKEVAVKVGYYNSVAFIRVFKKYEGITPGKHKETF